MCRRKNAQHRGMALFWTLGLLTVLMAVAAILTQTIVQTQRESRRREQRLQAELLADAALSRAAAQLARNASYQGEVWKMSDANDGLAYPAEMHITIKPVSESSTKRSVEIVVHYGATREHSLAVEKRARISVTPAAGESP